MGWIPKAMNKNNNRIIIGVLPNGKALGLGAGHRPQGIPKQKTPKSLVNTDFFGTLLSCKNLYKSGLTTDLTTYGN